MLKDKQGVLAGCSCWCLSVRLATQEHNYMYYYSTTIKQHAMQSSQPYIQHMQRRSVLKQWMMQCLFVTAILNKKNSFYHNNRSVADPLPYSTQDDMTAKGRPHSLSYHYQLKSGKRRTTIFFFKLATRCNFWAPNALHWGSYSTPLASWINGKVLSGPGRLSTDL